MIVKKTIVAIIVGALLSLAPHADADERGQLRVVTVPSGARIQVNGIELGLSPLTTQPLLIGEYEIGIIFTSGVHVTRVVNLLASQTITLEVTEPPSPPPPPPPPPSSATPPPATSTPPTAPLPPPPTAPPPSATPPVNPPPASTLPPSPPPAPPSSVLPPIQPLPEPPPPPPPMMTQLPLPPPPPELPAPQSERAFHGQLGLSMGVECPTPALCMFAFNLEYELSRYGNFHLGLLARTDSAYATAGPLVGFEFGTPYYKLKRFERGGGMVLSMAGRITLDLDFLFFPGDQLMTWGPTNTYGPNLMLSIGRRLVVYARLAIGWSLLSSSDFTGNYQCCNADLSIHFLLGARLRL